MIPLELLQYPAIPRAKKRKEKEDKKGIVTSCQRHNARDSRRDAERSRRSLRFAPDPPSIAPAVRSAHRTRGRENERQKDERVESPCR